jgi:hypothetical protein
VLPAPCAAPPLSIGRTNIEQVAAQTTPHTVPKVVEETLRAFINPGTVVIGVKEIPKVEIAQIISSFLRNVSKIARDRFSSWDAPMLSSAVRAP